MKRVAIYTLGCKVNHYESEAMMDLFQKAGYQVVDFGEQADVYIINTCTVTNEAARKSRQMARRAKRKNPDAVVAMVGCYTQVSPEEVTSVEGVDLAVGISKRPEIVSLVEEVAGGDEPEVDILAYNELHDYEELRVNEVTETTRAYVKIEEGCNQFCSYCIIPYARGPVRSRPQDLVLKEVETLVNKGVKEIVLTGTHLGAYGYEWKEEYSLEKLIEKLISIKGLHHIRLSSIEITEVTDRLLDLMSSEEKVCPHLHLPLQSGSDYILKKMKRPYTVAEFKEVVTKIRDKLEKPALTTDVIVGFPGETGELFRVSLKTVNEIGFSRLHVFPFSPREGTPAADMKDQIPGNIKKKYSREMRELNKELMLSYQKQFLGKERMMIVEEKRDKKTGLLTGMTDNYLRVLLDSPDYYQGKFIKVKLVESYNHEFVLGKIIDNKQELSV